MAFVWAAGILVVAYEIAGSTPQDSNSTANAEQPTDVTGSPINPEDEKKLEQAIRNL